MGRAKTVVFVSAGLLLAASMIPNMILGEYPADLPPIVGFGFLIALLPALSIPLRRANGRLYRVLARCAYCILAFGLACVCVLTAVMVRASAGGPPPSDADVIVPGCAIIGDRPRPMLKSRLDTAYSYLAAHPGARVVVTGGRFGDFTQAEVMKNYLAARGVDHRRILVDDRSDNTFQNMKNAAFLLGGSRRVVIATDVFHQLRAKTFAEKAGLVPFALPSPTPPNHIVDAWAREYAGVLKMLLTGG